MNADILSYINGMWRRRWYALAVASITCVVGWTTVAMIPDAYTSSARIYVDTETVLRPLLKGIAVESDVDSQVAVLEQTLLTRPNLEKMARATDLDLTATTPDQMEALLQSLRERTNLQSFGESRRGRRRSSSANMFSISYEDVQPQRAKEGVEALLDIFMESHLGESRTDMESARRFIDEQVEIYRRRLDEAEKRLAEFKQKNLRLLPGPGGERYQDRLDEAKKTLADSQAALEDAVTERDVLKEQLAMMPEVIEAIPGSGSGPPSDYALRLVELQTTLDQLLSKYTERHPDVLSVRKRIRQLEAEQQRQLPGNNGASLGGAPKLGVPNPAYSQLQLKLVDKETEIARLGEQIERGKNKVEQLQSMALKVPLVEAELKRLSRDYDVMKQQYEQLLTRREAAKISRESEAKGENIQFRIVEPPQLPIKPSGPDRPLLLSAVLPVGFGLGLVFAFVLAYLNETFSDPQRMSAQLNMPVLGTVSLVEDPKTRRRKLIEVTAFIALLVLVFAIYGLFLVLESRIGLGKIMAEAAQATSVGQLISIFAHALSSAFSSPPQ